METGVWLALAFVPSVGASSFLVGGARTLLLRYELLAVPNGRSSHQRPIPVGGGIVIVVTSASVVIAVAALHLGVTTRDALVFVVCGVALAVVSLLDDIHEVPYQIRLVVHAGVAATFIAGFSY